MTTYGDQFKRELDKVRKETDEVLARSGGDHYAAIRAGLDLMMRALPTDLAMLRAHGFEVDGGSYFLASMTGTLAMQGVNPLNALHDPGFGPLIREYVDKAAKL